MGGLLILVQVTCPGAGAPSGGTSEEKRGAGAAEHVKLHSLFHKLHSLFHRRQHDTQGVNAATVTGEQVGWELAVA